MNQYWASVERGKIGENVMAKVRAYREYLKDSGMLSLLRKSYDTYYGDFEINDVDGSLKAIHVNHYGSLLTNIHTMVTATRPAWEPRAVNTDTESQADTQLAAGLLDYYMREKQLEKTFSEAVEQCLFLKESWVVLGWDVSGGEIYGKDPETGAAIREGDVKYSVHTLLDMIRDIHRKDMNHKWFIIRTRQSKWDLAAKYPELAEKIKALSSENKDAMEYELAPFDYKDKDQNDLIDVFELRHERTDAMPDGRLSVILADDIVVIDGPLPYKKIYCHSITTAKCFESAFGHSRGMDILPIQDAFDMTVSAILTNQAANAVQNFKVPKGSAPRVTEMADGMNVWEYDPKAGNGLEPMELLRTPAEVFDFASFLVSQAELVSGVNQISRGNAPPQMSGTAMALIQQQALQYASGVQANLNSLSESVGTGTIELLQTFAVVPRVAMIVGKTKRSYLKTFKGSDLKGISRVVVDAANPLTKTRAGNMEMANQLLASSQGLIKTPEQYITVFTGGNLEPLYEHENGGNMLIRSENERLMEGQPVQVVMTDDDGLHVLEHACVLNSPEARENPAVVQVTLEHIQAHIEQARTKDPMLAAMLKQQSFAPPPMPPQGPGPAPVMDNQNPVTEQANGVALPEPAQPPPIEVA